MKCPKCGYLGFEPTDRCRNCSYEFALAPSRHEPLDLALDAPLEEGRPPIDLDRLIGVPEPEPAADLPLFGGDDRPLISAPARPRAPLGVRRATPEVPRARPRPSRPAAQDDTLFEEPPAAVLGRMAGHHATGADPLAAPGSRVLAGLVDVALLAALDAAVLYFTLRLLGLPLAGLTMLPLLPLAAFFLVLNGGYFVAFTAVGGQSIGKMALGIKVISQEDSQVPVAQATLRTLAYFVSALPLGAGFLPGVFGADRLALHDRLAHTRVVRPSSV